MLGLILVMGALPPPAGEQKLCLPRAVSRAAQPSASIGLSISYFAHRANAEALGGTSRRLEELVSSKALYVLQKSPVLWVI